MNSAASPTPPYFKAAASQFWLGYGRLAICAGVLALLHLAVPFGVLEVKTGGSLEAIVEKPEFDFLANTGMYLLKTDVIDAIPSDTKIDFPELLNKVRAAGGRVGVYPVSQQSWTDLGQWQEYQTAVKRLEGKS